MQFIEYYTESKKHNNNPHDLRADWELYVTTFHPESTRQYHTAYGKHQNSKFSRWKSIAFASSETQKKKKKK